MLAGFAATAIPISAVAGEDRLFRVAIDSLGNGLDPYHNYGPDVDRYSWLFGDGLTTGERVPRPMLAEVPIVLDRGMTYRYRLRHARWHDGTMLHSKHVIEALESLRHSISPWMTYEPYTLVRDVASRGDSVVDVRLRRPSPAFARTFFSPYGKPALPLLRGGEDGLPLGTGPFRFSRRLGDRYRLEGWSGSPRGVPASATLEVRLVSSATTLGMELAAGEVDLVLPIIRGLPAAKRYRIESRYSGTIVLLFNCAATFRTPNLRKAVLRAIDIGVLQRTIDPGVDERVDKLLPPGDPDDVAFAFPPRDLDRARAELRVIRAPITITYLAESRRYARLALLIAASLQSVGLEVEIVPRAQALYQGPLGPLATGRFDLAVYGLAYAEDPDLDADWGCHHRPPGGANYARYCNARFDQAAARGASRDALHLLVDDAPLVPLARNVESFGVGPYTAGFVVPPPFVPPTLGAHRWVRRTSSLAATPLLAGR